MEFEQAIKAIVAELDRAQIKFPNYPADPIHAAAIIVEEAGELQQAALQATYENGSIIKMEREAVQVGAMALRFLIWFDKLKCKKSDNAEPEQTDKI
jgi:NTP pyrophosphatase (non-canonical NTP hydrolase)